MQHVDGPSQAKEYADTALELMDKHEIPTTPRNFDIWYTYASGRDEELSAAIDLILSNNQPFTQDQNAALAAQFLTAGDPTTAIHDTSRKIEESVSTVLGFMSEATDGAATYGESLESNLGAMANAENLDSLRRAVETLVADTKGMAAQNSQLRDRLADSTNEIQSLREHLESVQQ